MTAAMQSEATKPAAGVLERAGALWRIAWPTVLSRAGILVMAMVDVVMVGHYSARELAYASLGMALFVPIMVSGIGLLLGVMVLISQAYGRDDRLACGDIFRRALPWAATLGLIGAAFCSLGETWLTLLGQEPDLARGGGAVARAVAIGVAAQLIYVTCNFYLEGTRRPRPGMVAMIVANLINIALNWVFIYGNLGAPALGAVGSALTTAAVRVFLMLALLGYIFSRPDAATFGLTLRWRTPDFRRFWGPGGWAAGAPMRRLGFASGVSIFFEVTGYAMLSQYAGWIGADVLAGYSVAHNLEALFFMIALGLSSATAVRVGAAFGRGDIDGAASEAWTGLAMVLTAMLSAAALVWIFPARFAAFYTSDPTVQRLAALYLPWVGGAILIDGAQLLMGQVTRALGDAWRATLCYAAAYWLVLLPAAYVLGVEAGYAGAGLLVGVMIGCSVAFLLLFFRFRRLLREARA